MNEPTTFACCYLPSGSVDDAMAAVSRLIVALGLPEGGGELVWQRFPPRKPEGVRWKGADYLERVHPLMRAAGESAAVHLGFDLAGIPGGAGGLWELHWDRSSIPSWEFRPGHDPLERMADREAVEAAVLGLVHQGVAQVAYHSRESAWVGDPAWIYLRHKWERVPAARERVLRGLAESRGNARSAGGPLHDLFRQTIDATGTFPAFTSVTNQGLKCFLETCDELLRKHASASALERAVSCLGVGAPEWFGRRW